MSLQLLLLVDDDTKKKVRDAHPYASNACDKVTGTIYLTSFAAYSEHTQKRREYKTVTQQENSRPHTKLIGVSAEYRSTPPPRVTWMMCGYGTVPTCGRVASGLIWLISTRGCRGNGGRTGNGSTSDVASSRHNNNYVGEGSAGNVQGARARGLRPSLQR